MEFNLSFVIIYRNIYEGSIVMLLLIWKVQHLSYFNHSFHLNFHFTNHNFSNTIFHWLPCCHKGTENHKEHCGLHLKGCLWPKNHYSQFRSYVKELLFSVQYLDYIHVSNMTLRPVHNGVHAEEKYMKSVSGFTAVYCVLRGDT